MITFTKEQLSEVMCKHAAKENGLHDLLEIMLESLMVAERSEFLHEQEDHNKGNGFRFGHTYGHSRKLEFRIPRDRFGNFHPKILAILRDQEEECEKLAGSLYTKGLTQSQVGQVFDEIYDCTSIANYIDNPANAANIEALNDAIKHKKQVVLKGYASAHSDETRNRVVEPFSFTANMIDVWAYDVEKAEPRMFKVMRIGSVEETETPWAFEDKHEVKKPDVFRMTGSPVEKIVLQLNTRAKSLLVEEYPLAERDLKREDGNWVLRTTINSVEGAGRFVIGLAADIKILQGKKLLDYIKKYDKKHIQKL